MDEISAVQRVEAASEQGCVICATRLRSGAVCERCQRQGLTPQQYAQLFWDEV